MESVDDNEDVNGVTMEPADDSEDVDSIENRICSSLVRSAFDAREYLPIDQLCKILSPSVVHNLLLQHFGNDKVLEYEREILGNQDETPVSPPRRRRILAILVLIDQVNRLPKFIKHGVDDTALPFHFNHIKPARRVTVSYMPHSPDEPRQKKDRTCQNPHRQNEPVLKKFDMWPCRIAKEFTLWQSIIHVPFLQFPGDKIYFYDLYQDSTLPFDRYELQSTGGYGSVRKVTIHPSHYNCHGNSKDQQCVCLAVKRLHTPNVHDYLQEVDLFDKLGAKIKDPLSEHLIPLQLTFKHGKDYFLMFPWADGNLKQFWSTRTANPEDPKQVCWFISQCSGIVSGLRRVHHITTRKSPKTVTQDDVKEILLGAKEWGRHGDIKPENILWFENYNSKQNHLVISDFGLTQFNSAHSRSKVQQGQIQGFSGTYRPPDLHIEDQPISQNYDVWSLGCVFLEFVSWFLLGHDETVFTFGDARLRDEPEGTIGEDTFFVFENGHHGTPKNAKLKDSVVEWIQTTQDTSVLRTSSRTLGLDPVHDAGPGLQRSMED
ncbi:Protein kinase domain-containing protein [Fusarium falciforme]|uniref:Protein kinase domain-containing protein n=1 Tax=Fusarium falciforme TaxID=195108 RepID=UPI002300BB52|nr:Protein kinase domain-containing protein [Fusarium falciforme]WAO87710.1 Protein kinase domain-containing protein [Fusarium falciforme]